MKKWITTSGQVVYQVLSGRSNSFLVSSNDKFLLVDTGRKNSWTKLSKNLDEILGENKLSCLILTHTHYDHAENAAKIKEKYGAKIIVQKNETNYLETGRSPLPRGTNILTRFLINNLAKKIPFQTDFEPIDFDIKIDQKYDLKFWGFNAFILPTPGHSTGSISVIIDNELAIVGDALFGVFKWSVYPPFADDNKIMIKSWGKLLETGCLTYLPGHGTEISVNLLKKQYAQHNRSN
jgi:glyoxylase-like metal-dependent hydrolase (beta-lactamase superfamily II)